MALEKRKAIKRADKTDAANREILAIGEFIRMIDYMVLESLCFCCIDCWKQAEANVAQPESSVFQIEVTFDEEGKVAFVPRLNDLLDTVSSILRESVNTLSTLPRVLTKPAFQPFLRDSGFDPGILVDQGPQVFQLLQCSDILDRIEKHILDVIKASYAEATLYAQNLSDFYPIYKLGQTWNVRDYVFVENGSRYEGPLTDHAKDEDINGAFLMKPELQPRIDITRVEKDIARYLNDAKRVANFRQGAIKGTLHIDYRTLKAHLTPIPQRALSDLQELLVNLVQMKIDKLLRAMRYYSKELRQDPKTLDDYVAFCELLKRTSDVIPRIASTIAFIERMHTLFDEYGIFHSQDLQSIRASFMNFKSAQTNAQNVREDKVPSFVDSLKMAMQEVETKLTKYYEKTTAVPATLKDADVDTRLPDARKLIVKVQALEPKVKTLLRNQEVMGLQMGDFAQFNEVLTASLFSVKLYEAVDRRRSICKLSRTTLIDSIKLRRNLLRKHHRAI
jgi:hypothetical protein